MQNSALERKEKVTLAPISSPAICLPSKTFPLYITCSGLRMHDFNNHNFQRLLVDFTIYDVQ